MSRLTNPLLAAIAAPVVAAGTAAGAFVLTGTHRRLGVTKEEAHAPLPGDDLLPDADLQNDRATTICAPAAAVWPWIAQLGQDKAGFYSWEVLENAMGCDIRNAERIVPEWQHPQAGDAFPLHPDLSLRVARVEPGRALVATSVGGSSKQDMGYDFTWAFLLTESPGSMPGRATTRLHIRERYRTPNAKLRAVVDATSIASAIMTGRMMHTIKELAEANR